MAWGPGADEGSVRVHLFDPSGCGLGLAVGLAELGHTVVHRGPSGWRAANAGETARACGELAQRYCAVTPIHDDQAAGCDLLVIVDVFADFLHALENRTGGHRPVDLTRPLHETANPVVYPDRLRHWLELATRSNRTAFVDMSDASTFREVGFEGLPHATLLARECPLDGVDRWQPFPFLYNNLLLWLEHMRPEREWWVPRPRAFASDWVFCGTVDHPRYQGRRQQALQRAAQRWPLLRGNVVTQASFVEVVQILQSARSGLDLPGAGELCFRLHECLALGTPVLRPEPGSMHLAAGLRSVVVADPDELQPMAAEDVRRVYRACCSPRAAASTLLAAVAANGLAVHVAS